MKDGRMKPKVRCLRVSAIRLPQTTTNALLTERAAIPGDDDTRNQE